MLHAVIMAGGSGTRFWPVSTRTQPKQLQALYGERSLLAGTVERLTGLVPAERTMIVTNERLVGAIRQQMPALPKDAVIGEPAKRDTAPCIGLAALLVSQQDKDAVMAVMPADHVIEPADAFTVAIQQAVKLVEQSPDRLVTFGIRPTYPAESFGYIQRGDKLDSAGASVFQVARFREKPNAQTAQQYLDSGNFYWNSGIFVWRADTILSHLKTRAPQMLEHLQRISAVWSGPQHDQVFKKEFTAIEGTSIDYAVMEHADNVAVIEAPFQWDDLGSWQSLARLVDSDAAGNTVIGRHVGVDTRGTIVRSEGEHVVVTLGVEDLVVVNTPHATLVANKQDEERIREVVQELEARGWDDVL